MSHGLPQCPLCTSPRTELFVIKDGYPLYRCRSCGVRFVHPVPDTRAVYEEPYFRGATRGFGYVDYDTDKQPMLRTFEKYLRHIRRYVPDRGRLLDVGTATGVFLSLAAANGFEATGVEISPYAAARAQAKGLAVTVGTLADVAPGKPFDVISLFDVIEHVPNPSHEITHAHALLRPGGVIAITTPDIGSWYATLLGKRWHLIVPPEHLYFFNRASLRKLLTDKGFEVLFVGSIGKQFTLSYLFKTLYQWQKMSLWKWLSGACTRPPFSWVKIPINLHDTMFVLARKNAL